MSTTSDGPSSSGRLGYGPDVDSVATQPAAQPQAPPAAQTPATQTPAAQPQTAPTHPTTVLYAAISLDGYLAGPDDGLGFLDDVTDAGAGYAEFYSGVAALVMGRRTYDLVRSMADWPYADRRCVVVTSTHLADAPPGVTTDPGDDLPRLLAQLRTHGTVWVVGGGVLARSLLAEHLVDELDLTVTPHLLGDGVPLWGVGTASHRLELRGASSVGSGAVRMRYRVRHG